MQKVAKMAEYYISFNTMDMKPNIKAVKVTIHHELITDMDKRLPINLCDDPLYRELHSYCMHNPPRKVLE